MATKQRRVMTVSVFCTLSACIVAPGEDRGRDASSPRREEPRVGADDEGGGGASCGIVRDLTAPLPDGQYVPGSYRGRTFLGDGVHLGEDVALPEGTPVHASGPGRIVYYGPASGYGELVVVVEYDFGTAREFRNGAAGVTSTRRMILIAGHLRVSAARGGAPTGFEVGNCVGADTVVGYVNDDAHNGDGAEHLHLGCRLMSASEAWSRDGRYAYRGYDDHGRFRGDFTAASTLFSGASPPNNDVADPPHEGADEAAPAPAAAPSCTPEPEICDGMDNDCNGMVDDGIPYIRCGESACERIVPGCVDGHPNRCVPGTPEPEICGDGVDNDCNGRIDDGCESNDPPPAPPPPPPACGKTVSVRWQPGFGGWTFMSDLYPDRHWGTEEGTPSFSFDATCVIPGEHRMNADFGAGRWGCGEWPEGVLNVPFGPPRVFTDGRELGVDAREEPGLDLGCNFFVQVPE